MFRAECIPSLPDWPGVSTPLERVIYSPCIHHTHAFVARGQRKCELIYSRHLLWEHSLLLTEDKSTGAAHLPLLSFLPYPEIYTWRCLNLLTRGKLSVDAEIPASAISLREMRRDLLSHFLCMNLSAQFLRLAASRLQRLCEFIILAADPFPVVLPPGSGLPCFVCSLLQFTFVHLPTLDAKHVGILFRPVNEASSITSPMTTKRQLSPTTITYPRAFAFTPRSRRYAGQCACCS